MSEIVIDELVNMLNITKKQIVDTLNLLSEGATIPFIARYRKEVTGGLTEDDIKAINDKYEYYNNLLDRKNAVIRLIDEKGLLTEELREQILACSILREVEDLYRPYKEKKKTKATDAINAGLEPLAKKIMSFPENGSIESLAKPYLNDIVKTIEEAITGAGYIIAEWISDNAYYRKWIVSYLYKNSSIESKIKKGAMDEKKTYEMYYDFSEPIKRIKHYRILAINRGEKEDVLKVNLTKDEDEILSFLNNKIIKNDKSFVIDIVKDSIKDSFKRLIYPSIEREVRNEITERAEETAIKTFGVNLEHLLLTRPLKGMNVLGFDPGYVNGCKIAVIDENGTYLDSCVIKPFLNNVSEDSLRKDKEKIRDLIVKYNVNIVSIGNGTASRESETFVASLIDEYKLDCKYAITSEAGASIYSASKLASEEFPDLAIEKRSAVSIGRRIQDPLSELVKIDPKSIGVGEYQYDVNQKTLGSTLDFVTSKVVNEVGVNINTCSKSILKYVSGLTKSVIEHIYDYKSKHRIKSREEIKKIKGVSDKIYEQAIGFLRIPDGDNPLDITGIHPESYDLTYKILGYLNLDIKDLNSNDFKDSLKKAKIEDLCNKYQSDTYTITDIINELLCPGLDPRDELEAPILKSNVLTINDLHIGDELMGTVRNVASFGAFVDIGLHDDGLIHISKMSREFVSNPNDILNVGDIVKCYVDNIDIERNKVGLSLLKNK